MAFIVTQSVRPFVIFFISELCDPWSRGCTNLFKAFYADLIRILKLYVILLDREGKIKSHYFSNKCMVNALVGTVLQSFKGQDIIWLGKS